jgi:hypothetical protein
MTRGDRPRRIVRRYACRTVLEGRMDDWRPSSELDVVAQRTNGLTTLEVRWIRRGPVPDSLVDRLTPSPVDVELREDRYLVGPELSRISVKIRDGIQLDVKVCRGSPGELLLPGGACGRLETWEKWTVPLVVGARPVPDPASGWRVVHKLRRKRFFHVIDGSVVERSTREGTASGCVIELTEVLLDDGVWWTLGFEASGAATMREQDLTQTARLLLRSAGAEAARLDRRDSMSYVEWLQSEPDRQRL